MDLSSFILKTGRRKSAKLFGVSYPCVCHWVNGVRRPGVDQALTIIRKSPVTWDGIYNGKRKAA